MGESASAVTRSAERLDGFYMAGCRQWNDWLYELHPLGVCGQIVAQAVFAVVLLPVLLAGAYRRLRRGEAA